jgi:hypothetical protein
MVLLYEALQPLSNYLLMLVGRGDGAGHQVNDMIHRDVAEHVRGKVAQIARMACHPLPTPMCHDAAGKACILKVGLKVVDDGIWRSAGAQGVDAVPVPEKGGNADADRFNGSAEIFDARSMGPQTIRSGEDQETLRRDRDRRVDAMVFVAKRQHLRTKLESNTSEVVFGYFVVANDE